GRGPGCDGRSGVGGGLDPRAVRSERGDQGPGAPPPGRPRRPPRAGGGGAGHPRRPRPRSGRRGGGHAAPAPGLIVPPRQTPPGDYPLVRREAVRALSRIGGAPAARVLVGVAAHDLSAEVREEAVAALAAILREGVETGTEA